MTLALYSVAILKKGKMKWQYLQTMLRNKGIRTFKSDCPMSYNTKLTRNTTDKSLFENQGNSITVTHALWASRSKVENIWFPLGFLIHHTRAIITRGLYAFYPIFEDQKRLFKQLFFVKFWPCVQLVFKSGL